MDTADDLLGIEDGYGYVDDEQKIRVQRGRQTEQQFLLQKASWKPVFENGDLWQQTKGDCKLPVSKQEFGTIFRSMEESYYLRQYSHAIRIADQTLARRMEQKYVSQLREYRRRCVGKSSGI